MKRLLIASLLVLSACAPESKCVNPSKVTSVTNCANTGLSQECDVATENGITQRILRADGSFPMPVVGDTVCTH